MIAGIVDDGKITERYTVVVTGDVVADGMINISDMMAVKSYILGKSSLATANLKAADVNATPDGSINIVDFMRIKAHILKKDTITGVAVN